MRKNSREPTTKKQKHFNVGDETGLLDAFGNQIKIGDLIRLKNTNYDGPVLYNSSQKSLGILFGLWYGDKNPYDENCYGKFIPIPNDNGMRMELIPTKPSELIYDRLVYDRMEVKYG